jgi:hypothetical protein
MDTRQAIHIQGHTPQEGSHDQGDASAQDEQREAQGQTVGPAITHQKSQAHPQACGDQKARPKAAPFGNRLYSDRARRYQQCRQ